MNAVIVDRRTRTTSRYEENYYGRYDNYHRRARGSPDRERDSHRHLSSRRSPTRYSESSVHSKLNSINSGKKRSGEERTHQPSRDADSKKLKAQPMVSVVPVVFSQDLAPAASLSTAAAVDSPADAEQDEERLLEERRARRKALLQQAATQVAAQVSLQETGTHEPLPGAGKDAHIPSHSQQQRPDRSAPTEQPQQEPQQQQQQQQQQQAQLETAPALVPEADSDTCGELDMFSDDITEAAEGAGGGVLVHGTQGLDMWQDADGYMQVPAGIRIGPQRAYTVKSTLGKGMFAVVVAASVQSDTSDTSAVAKEVAVKVFRANELIRRQGLRELRFLEQILEADPADRCHLLRLRGHFTEGTQKHLCLEFDRMEMNARELLLKHGRHVGLAPPLVSALSHQLLRALVCLRSMRLVHADLKPDNVLVDTRRELFVRLADFNSALAVSEVSLTAELQSRFYRAPEVMLGAHEHIEHAIDMWSLGCTLFELYTGHVLLAGRDNNHMLYLMQLLRGPLPKRLVKAGAFAAQHHDADGSFLQIVEDAARKSAHARPTHFPSLNPGAAVNALLMQLCASRVGGARTEADRLCAEFLDRCLTLDPKQRITPEEALAHPFVLLWKTAAVQV